MKHTHGKYRLSISLILTLALLCGTILSGCGAQPTQDDPQPQLEMTQIALGSTQAAFELLSTIQAQQATIVNAQVATLQSQPPTSTPVVATTAPVEVVSPTAPPPQEPTTTPPPEQAMSVEDFMQTASILLYEDMRVQSNTFPFVKTTLDNMGLQYVNVGGARGNLKKQMLYETPPGGWDLIIIAAESKSEISGEFFDYIMEALDQGSSVILETWYLDRLQDGMAKKLMQLCGVEVQRDWSDVKVRAQIMWPLRPDHPILNEPNSDMSFTDVTSYWADKYDIGDLLRPAPGGNPTFILGEKSWEPNNYGTVTVCIDDQLILQTFSSHQITYEQMEKLWENYIYFALSSRLERLQ
jgi:hypothetical protein